MVSSKVCCQYLFKRILPPTIQQTKVPQVSSQSTSLRHPLSRQRRANYSTSPVRHAEPPTPTSSKETSSASRNGPASLTRFRSLFADESSQPSSSPPDTERSAREAMKQITNILGAGERKGWPQASPSQPASPRRTRPSVARQFDDLFGNRNSKSKDSGYQDDILDLFKEIKNDPGVREQRERVRAGEKFDQQRLAAQLSTNRLDDFKDEFPLRLKPALGRTINLLNLPGGKDLTRAFRQLEMKCASNSVRSDERDQRTHIRRGMRKKLERRQRWRVLFKQGFLAECARIRRMRKQGW